MTHKKTFIDWKLPITKCVPELLLADRISSGMVDMSGTLVVVPTAQAGRRLRMGIAGYMGDRGVSVLGLNVVTPSFLIQALEGVAVANPAQESAVWMHILEEIDLEEFDGLFPVAPSSRDAAWAVANADLINGVRAQLADGCLRIQDVLKSEEIDPNEVTRWENLQQLELMYLEKLREAGFEDTIKAKLEYVETPRLDEKINRIVVVAVPDPSGLALRALQNLAKEIETEIVVHAPAALVDHFDEWGRPKPGAWSDIPIPDTDQALTLVTGPSQQAKTVVNLLERNTDQLLDDTGALTVALGVPDSEVTQRLVNQLEDAGIKAHDPAPVKLETTSLHRLLLDFYRLNTDHDLDAMKALVRHPDVLFWLKQTQGVYIAEFLKQLDDHILAYLPETWVEFLGSVERHPSPMLKVFVNMFNSLLENLQSESLVEGIRRLLSKIYTDRSFQIDKAESRLFLDVSDVIKSILEEIESVSTVFPEMDREQLFQLLLQRMSKMAVPVDRADALVDLEGWLELHWNDAPVCIVTGMNEGKVPSVRIEDTFLPDSVKKQLSLRDDSRLLARDAYIMRALIESRETTGRVFFILGRQSAMGDPLKPSRLLFHCNNDILPLRALKLFGPVVDPQPRAPRQTMIQLDCRPPSDLPLSGISPVKIRITALKEYIKCPFRYYLQNVVGMQEKNYLKVEPDCMDFGTIVHKVFEVVLQKPGMAACTDADKLFRAFASATCDYYRKTYGFRLSAIKELSQAAVLKRLRIAARHQVEHAALGWRPIAFEKSIEVSVGNISLSGRIDRIDKNQEGDFLIIDYKTTQGNSIIVNSHLVKTRDSDPAGIFPVDSHPGYRWVDLQVPLYAYWLQNKYETASVEGAYFKIAGVHEHSGLDTWKSTLKKKPALDQTLMASACMTGGQIADLILSRQFWPPNKVPTMFRHKKVIEKILGDNPEQVVDPGSIKNVIQGGRS